MLYKSGYYTPITTFKTPITTIEIEIIFEYIFFLNFILKNIIYYNNIN